MKKSLFFLSILLMTIWIAGVFIFKASAGIHVLLVLSILSYIRSLMLVEERPGNIFSGWKW